MTRALLLFSSVVAAAADTRPSAHFYFVGDVAGTQSLELNAEHIRVLSPVWIFVRPNGELKVNVDPKVLGLAAAYKIELWPVVMNQDFRLDIARAVLSDPKKVDALAGKLASTAAVHRFQGLQLDFENIETPERAGYTRLTQKLRHALGRHEIGLSVAVAAPLYSTGGKDGKPLEWHETKRSEAFDYEQLGAASDFLTLMSYDQYATPEAPGPVAGISWMEACVRKLLESVPAQKIQLGLPLYHRRWSGSVISTGSWAEAQTAAIKAGVPWKLDPLHDEPVVRFQEGTVQHTIWFEDARSLARRMELIHRYSLRGFSAWRLGQEDPSVWPVLFAGRGSGGCR